MTCCDGVGGAFCCARRSRVLVVLLAVLAHLALPEHEASGALQVRAAPTCSSRPCWAPSPGGMPRILAAADGWTCEQRFAFFPLYPLLVRVLSACRACRAGRRERHGRRCAAVERSVRGRDGTAVPSQRGRSAFVATSTPAVRPPCSFASRRPLSSSPLHTRRRALPPACSAACSCCSTAARGSAPVCSRLAARCAQTARLMRWWSRRTRRVEPRALGHGQAAGPARRSSCWRDAVGPVLSPYALWVVAGHQRLCTLSGAPPPVLRAALAGCVPARPGRVLRGLPRYYQLRQLPNSRWRRPCSRARVRRGSRAVVQTTLARARRAHRQGRARRHARRAPPGTVLTSCTGPR